MTEFINHFIGSVFKILPLKEDNNIGLNDYMDSVVVQAYGALNRYKELDNNEFNSVINTLVYMQHNVFTVKQCKREVFKCINLLEKIKEGR